MMAGGWEGVVGGEAGCLVGGAVATRHGSKRYEVEGDIELARPLTACIEEDAFYAALFDFVFDYFVNDNCGYVLCQTKE